MESQMRTVRPLTPCDREKVLLGLVLTLRQYLSNPRLLSCLTERGGASAQSLRTGQYPGGPGNLDGLKVYVPPELRG